MGGTFALQHRPKASQPRSRFQPVWQSNLVTQSIRARIEGAGTNVTSGGRIDVIASSQSTIDTKAVSVAGAVAIVNPKEGFALGLAGAGADAGNVITNSIVASIAAGASVSATDTIAVRATDSSTIVAIVPAVSLSLALGLGASVSVTNATNLIGNTVDARITGAQARSTAGSVIIEAQSSDQTDGFATPLAASASIGGAGTGGQATAYIGGRTQAEAGRQAFISAPLGEVRVSSSALLRLARK